MNIKRTFGRLSAMVAAVATTVVLNTAAQSVEEFTPAIEDNSFYIEEAYNQEAGIVQHILTAEYFTKRERHFALGFTQEWPVSIQTHQLSMTIPYEVPGQTADGGIGDAYLNYRYQLLGPEDWVAASPRFSVILPTGSKSKGLGQGVTGFEINLPFSKRLNDAWVVHANIGATLLPGIAVPLTGGGEATYDATVLWLGGSVIWLVNADLNLVLEAVRFVSREMGSDGTVAHPGETLINPGIRYAINSGSLQIVPGVGFPYLLSGEAARWGMFLYLSFEHPF